MTSLHADEAFLGHYQLSHDPFAPRVPGFKFFPAQRKPVLGQLHHLARYSQLLLAVTGPHGSGKTLLRQALVASTNKQSVQSVVVSARGAGDAAGILRQIAQGLSVPQAEVRTLLAQVVQMALIGQEVYVLVDDAEQLDESALEALLALAAGAPEGRPHVFLFGEASLIPRMERVSVQEERFHVIELAPYTEEETREYLAQRLEGAGKGIELLSAAQISDIHEHSDGWPGTINQVARDSMIEAMLASRTAVKRPGFSFNVPKKHLLALVVIGLGVIAAFLMQGRTSTDNAATAPAVANSGVAVPLGQAPQPAKPQSNNTDANSGQPAAAPAKPAGSPAIEFAGNSQPMPLPMVGKPQPVMRGNLAEQAGAEPAPDGDDDGVTDPGPSTAPPTVTTSAPPVGMPAAAPTAKPAPAPAAPVAKPAPQVAKAEPAAKPAAKPAVAAPAAPSNGAGWYAAQPANNYVVQILGTSSEATAQGFVHEQGGEYRYFKKTLQGKPLYVVTYGNFASRPAALAAMKDLPAKVQAGKPWPRTIGTIQQEVSGH